MNLADINSIKSIAYSLLGKPYVYGGSSINGFDCSGFVQYVYSLVGVGISRSTYTQLYDGVGVSYADAQPGDIVSYGYNGYVSHSALYIGNGMIVHASTPELGIRVDSMYIMPIVSVRRGVYEIIKCWYSLL